MTFFLLSASVTLFIGEKGKEGVGRRLSCSSTFLPTTCRDLTNDDECTAASRGGEKEGKHPGTFKLLAPPSKR